MAKTKEVKNYKVIVLDGFMTVSMNEKGKDGRYHSAKTAYPMYQSQQDAETGKIKVVRLKKSQVEKELVAQMAKYYA